MREYFLLAIGIVGGVITSSLGGWDSALQTLFLFMATDYLTGFIVAAVFKKSQKSDCGAFSSVAGIKGLIKKGMLLVLVMIGYHFDILIGWEFARYAIIVALIVNEAGSIIENAGLIGVPIPNALKQAIDILKKKAGDGDDE